MNMQKMHQPQNNLIFDSFSSVYLLYAIFENSFRYSGSRCDREKQSLIKLPLPGVVVKCGLPPWSTFWGHLYVGLLIGIKLNMVEIYFRKLCYWL